MPIDSKKITTSAEMSELLKHIHFDTVVLFDLDNTVMEAQLELGSDQWFVQMCMQVVAKIPEKDKAITWAVALYHEVQKIVRTQAVEEATVKIIRALQDIGIPIIAITARDECLHPATTRQLADIGIELHHLEIPPLELPIAGNTSSINPIYEQGVIYCGGRDKGACFRAFLESTKAGIKHVVMVDDKEKYLHQVGAVAEELGIRFDGVRYSHLDQKVADFDMSKAQEQLTEVAERLPEELTQHLNNLELSSNAPRPTMSYAGFFYSTKLDRNSAGKDQYSRPQPNC
jgi:hypothetical protein